MHERLQKILSRAGISSRRAAEELITSGRVTVNGAVVTELGTKADPDRDIIAVDGRQIDLAVAAVYIALYKPAGYMTTLKDPEGRPLVTDLLKDIRERVYPVGRLDYNTEGLLLLTNDGAWANALAHPRHEVDKEYHVRVRGGVAPQQLRLLAAGVELEDGKTAPAAVRIIKESDNNTWLSITIHEGRYRQVRRMCEAVSLSVVRLKRARYGFVGLEGLKSGKYRFLTDDEVTRLRRLGQGEKVAATPPAKPGRTGGGKKAGEGGKPGEFPEHARKKAGERIETAAKRKAAGTGEAAPLPEKSGEKRRRPQPGTSGRNRNR